MSIVTLFSAVTSASANSKTVGILNADNSPDTVTWQVSLSSTGSVTLAGSLDGTNFYPIGSAVTTSGIQQTPKYPYVRAEITANAGTITVLVAYD